MKSRLIYLILSLVALMAAPSCRELAQDGDLAGQWQILTVEHPDGSVTNPEVHYYYCFYRDVAQLTNTNTTRITASMVYDEDQRFMSLTFPYEPIAYLAPWGISQTGSAFAPDATPDPESKTVTFKISYLSSKKLVMTAPGGNVITCRKY